MPTDQTPLADYGVVPNRPDIDRDAHWRVTFLGGVNAQTLLFADEPEHRAIEALCERFGQTDAMITPPSTAPASPMYEDDDREPIVAAVLLDENVRRLNVSAEQVAAVVAALGGLNPIDPNTQE